MNNTNNPRQTPEDGMKKSPGPGKPMGDQSQKAQPKDDTSPDLDRNKSNDVNKNKPSDQGQKDQRSRH